MQRFFGGNPAMVVLRLMIVSVIVGVLLSALGLDPLDIIESFQQLLIRIYDMGFDAVEWAMRYFLLGAVIVFPIWFVARLLKLFGKGDRTSAPLDRKSQQSDF